MSNEEDVTINDNDATTAKVENKVSVHELMNGFLNKLGPPDGEGKIQLNDEGLAALAYDRFVFTVDVPKGEIDEAGNDTNTNAYIYTEILSKLKETHPNDIVRKEIFKAALKMNQDQYIQHNHCLGLDVQLDAIFFITFLPDCQDMTEYIFNRTLVKFLEDTINIANHLEKVIKVTNRAIHESNNIKNKNRQLESSSFPKAGIKFSFLLNEFLPNSCKGRQAIQGWTTEKVCKDIIMPFTSHAQSSYCDILKEQNHPEYGDNATVFISHAHRYLFLDVLSALEWHLRDEPDTIIWFDLFSINQHLTTDWSFDWLSTTFKTAIGQFGRVIMVMSPWNNPLPFTRAWCVFEAYCTAVTNSKFEIAMSETDQKNFLESVKVTPKECIDEVLVTIRARKSQCFSEKDRIAIFSVIEDTVGFAKLDTLVFECYRTWVIEITKYALEKKKKTTTTATTRTVKTSSEEDDDEDGDGVMERLALLRAIGILYRAQGKLFESEKYLKERLDLSLNVCGEGSKEYLSSLFDIAEVYLEQGKDYEKVVETFQECYDKRKIVLGADHRDTLDSLHSLAVSYSYLPSSNDNTDRCRSLLEECFKRQEICLGPNHRDTLRSMSSLAETYERYEEITDKQRAEDLHRICYVKRKNALGDDHPDTAISLQTYGSYFLRQKDYGPARDALERCVEIQTALLGKHNPETVSSMGELASVYYGMGNWLSSVHLYQECLDIQTEILGPNHPKTLTTLHNLACIYHQRGSPEKAKEMFQDCYNKRLALFGINHPHTVNTKDWLDFCSNDEAAASAAPSYHGAIAKIMNELSILLGKNMGLNDKSQLYLEYEYLKIYLEVPLVLGKMVLKTVIPLSKNITITEENEQKKNEEKEEENEEESSSAKLQLALLGEVMRMNHFYQETRGGCLSITKAPPPFDVVNDANNTQNTTTSSNSNSNAGSNSNSNISSQNTLDVCYTYCINYERANTTTVKSVLENFISTGLQIKQKLDLFLEESSVS